MKIIGNQNAMTAACYGGLAALKLAAGEVAEALAYLVAAAVHGLAVRRERRGPPAAADH